MGVELTTTTSADDADKQVKKNPFNLLALLRKLMAEKKKKESGVLETGSN